MRSDTKRLLDRLGQPDFSYREYDDSPVSSTDRWPLFEVVARQLRPGLGRTLEDKLTTPQTDEASEPTGNDIQSLIARLGKGRAA